MVVFYVVTWKIQDGVQNGFIIYKRGSEKRVLKAFTQLLHTCTRHLKNTLKLPFFL